MSFSTHTNGSSAQGSVAAALAYHRRGWRVTPLDGKRPTTHDWQTARQDETELPGIFGSGNRNVGVVLGEASGGLADVES